jgi:pimeloyl-ACP methyl ester carboxylesterase
MTKPNKSCGLHHSVAGSSDIEKKYCLIRKRFYRLQLIVILLIVVAACQKEDDDRQPEFLVEHELLASFTRAEIISYLDDFGDLPGGLSFMVTHDVSVYKIVYNTIDTRNNPIPASGALVVPHSSHSLPMLSFQHGTLRSEQDAPSYFSLTSYLSALVYASTGYIMVLPDYLGYGSSRHIDHPYEHGRSLATASRDMLRAVREFDERSNEFSANNKLFLTGYSEGGYATMALLKLLEEEHLSEFTVTAATAGAGAYNKSEFARHILQDDTEMRYLNSFLWVLDTYNSVYGLDRPYSYYFNDPHAEIIRKGGVFANTELNPGNLFHPDFRDNLLNGSDTDFMEALADNDNFDWKPVTPLQLYHGTDDDYVFFFNSESAMEAMENRGASRVELITVEGGDHATTIVDYLTGTFLFFTQHLN